MFLCSARQFRRTWHNQACAVPGCSGRVIHVGCQACTLQREVIGGNSILVGFAWDAWAKFPREAPSMRQKRRESCLKASPFTEHRLV